MQTFFDKRTLSERLSIILPFLVISLALGVLAVRSYFLSERMEQGLEGFAAQYVGYAGEGAARRADAAVRAELIRASQTLEGVERQSSPSFESLSRWMEMFPWIVSAIYVPDDDPTGSIFVSAGADPSEREFPALEFNSPSGATRYTYDPAGLARVAESAMRRQRLPAGSRVGDAPDLRSQTTLELVRLPDKDSATRSSEQMSLDVPLESPLGDFAIRVSVSTAFANEGWENHRVVSLCFAGIAFLLVAVGAWFAVRGLEREAEAMKLRAALIANVSHELRTPLSMIRLGAETLKKGDRLKPEERESLTDSILREVVHLTHMVENVLDVARIQQGGKELAASPVSPRDLVVSLVSSYEPWIRSRGFEVDLDVPERDAIDEQMWDREAVSRALLNLIDNAIKYSANEKQLRVRLSQTADHVVIAVSDRGIGIGSRDLKSIFDPWFRAQFTDTETRRGAGLGLTLVKQIVSRHGGKIEVESTPGSGSTFRLVFPRTGSQQPGRFGRLRAREAE